MGPLLTAATSIEPSAVDVTRLLAALAVLLFVARGFGEVARRLNQPAVLGELLAGFLLGPAVLGRVAPQIGEWLFPREGATHLVFDGICTLATVLFLLAAGLEVDLFTALRQGRRAAVVGVLGVAAPFGLGLVAVWLAPRAVGFEAGSDPTIYALFFATALSISALPVIAGTLMDLHLYRTEFGMTAISAAMLNDLLGWTVFAVVLGMAGTPTSHLPIVLVVALTILFAVLALTLLRSAIHRALPWIQAHTTWPEGVVGFALALALSAAALTHWIGIEAVFGAFLAGVALGGSSHLSQRTRTTIGEFVGSFFAPIFFASIGLKVDFGSHFDLGLTLAVIAIACAGKVGACAAGARLSGMAPREAWAMGFAMNARGMMGIVLGLTALREGLIGERMFVSLVLMALFTSALAGPAIQAALGRTKPRERP